MGICISCDLPAERCQCGQEAQRKIRDAIARRDSGIETAGSHADKVSRAWVERAYEAMVAYVAGNANPFLVEQFREWAMRHVALVEPPDRRAWGAVTTLASKRRLIEKAGAAPATSSNLSLKWQWKRV